MCGMRIVYRTLSEAHTPREYVDENTKKANCYQMVGGTFVDIIASWANGWKYVNPYCFLWRLRRVGEPAIREGRSSRHIYKKEYSKQAGRCWAGISHGNKQASLFDIPKVLYYLILVSKYLLRWKERDFVPAVFWLVNFLGRDFWLVENPWSTFVVIRNRWVNSRESVHSQLCK